jgi:Putative lumazine-binding
VTARTPGVVASTGPTPAAGPAPGTAGPQVEVVAEVAEVLLTYLDGLHHGDTARLRRVFHPEARYTTATDGTLLTLSMAEYLPIVDARPAPAGTGEPRRDRIVSIELAGPVTAVARVECAIAPRRFVDILTLVQVDGRWQIVSKVFHYEIDEVQ